MSLRLGMLVFAIVLIAGSLQPAQSQVRVGIGIEIGPPPVRREVVAPRPAYDAVWVKGYWSWDPESRKHVWVPGRWVAARPGYRWVDGHWRKGPRGWVWTEGRWAEARGRHAHPVEERVPRRGGERR